MKKLLMVVLCVLFTCGMMLYAQGDKDTSAVGGEMKEVRMFWTGTNEPFDNFIANANKILEPEGIRIKYESVPFAQFNDKQLSMAVSGNTPDFGPVNMMIATSMFEAGFFTPLNDYIAKSEIVDFNDFLPGPWNNPKVGETIYGLPYEADDRLLYVNLTAFEAANVPVPTSEELLTMGWDGFVKLAQKLTVDIDGDGSIDQYGFTFVGGEHNHFFHDAADLWNQIGGELINKEATKALCNEPPFVETVALYAELFQKGVVPPDSLNYMSYDDSRNTFANNKAAMWICGPWELEVTPTINPDIRMQVVDLPLNKNGQKASSGGGWHLAIYEGSKQKDTAWRAIEALISVMGTNGYHTFSCYKPTFDLPPINEEKYSLFVEYLQYTKSPTYAFESLDEAWKTCMVEIQQAIMGNKTPQKAMDDAAVKVEKLL